MVTSPSQGTVIHVGAGGEQKHKRVFKHTLPKSKKEVAEGGPGEVNEQGRKGTLYLTKTIRSQGWKKC